MEFLKGKQIKQKYILILVLLILIAIIGGGILGWGLEMGWGKLKSDFGAITMLIIIHLLASSPLIIFIFVSFLMVYILKIIFKILKGKVISASEIIFFLLLIFFIGLAFFLTFLF